MKQIVGILLSTIAVINCASVDNKVASSFVLAPASLFEEAWKYQNSLKELQQDINDKLTAIRTSVSTVLRSSSNTTLTQVESNANQLLAQEEPARKAIFDLASSVCVNNLKVLINGITEFTGFGSSNCVATYDKNLNGVLNTAYALLQKYEGTYGDVQQIVVRSFIGKNAFLQADEIEARFGENYNLRYDEWQLARPDVEEFVDTLSGNVAVLNSALETCFEAVQENVVPAYVFLQDEISTCNNFDNTADPFAMFR